MSAVMHSYSRPEYKEDHIRKMFLEDLERGIPKHEAVKRAREKADTNVWELYNRGDVV